MNWVLILVLLIVLYNILRGYRKGFLRIMYSLVSWIVMLIFVIWSKPYINDFLLEHTRLYEKVEIHCEEFVRENAEKRAEEGLTEQNYEMLEELEGLGIRLPAALVDSLIEKTVGTADELLESTGAYTQIAGAMAGLAVEGIACLIALIGAGIVVSIISQILGIVSQIPILKGANRFAGLFAGGLYGLVLVWIAFSIVALCSASEFGSVMVSYIYESSLLKFLYENNLVLTVILHYL